MKIFKGNYGWSTSAHSKNKEGKDLKCYLDIQFAKRSDPEGTDIEGDLIFTSKDGRKWTGFFSSYESKGLINPKLVLMPVEEKAEQIPMIDSQGNDMFMRNVDISTEELPFY